MNNRLLSSRQHLACGKMEKLVGAVQDTLESGARAIDSAINDINQSSANPTRHPQRLARLVSPQLLVIQSPVYRQFLLCSSLVATKAAIISATLEFLRLARGVHRFREDAEAFGGSVVSSDSAVTRLEVALAQVELNLYSNQLTQMCSRGHQPAADLLNPWPCLHGDRPRPGGGDRAVPLLPLLQVSGDLISRSPPHRPPTQVGGDLRKAARLPTSSNVESDRGDCGPWIHRHKGFKSYVDGVAL